MLKHLLLIINLNACSSRSPANAEIHVDSLDSVAQNSLIDLKIVGGIDVEPNQYGYLVGIAIKEPKEKTGWCGGALISRNYVLTAAHCLKNVHRVTLFIGTHNIQNISDQAFIVNVERKHFRIHANWTQRFAIHDIALVHLPQAVPLTTGIKLINLPTSKVATQLKNGDKLQVIGWGRTSYNSTKARPATPKVIILPIVEQAICQQLYYYYNNTFNICLDGNMEQSTCRGDSGSPLVYTDVNSNVDYLIGLVSYGKKCRSATVLTRVAYYLSWIEENIKHIFELNQAIGT